MTRNLHNFPWRTLSLALALGAVAALSAGCADDDKNEASRKQAFRTRQRDALADPYHYSPFEDQSNDVSGGGLLDVDKKAFKRDVRDVLNP